MSKSKEFLLGKLKELYDSFDGIKIRYEFDEHMDLHLIEVLPLETFENDNIFILQEIKIQDEFEALFGETEEILFVSSDSLNEIKSPAMKFGYEDEEIKPTPLVKRHFSFNSDLKEEDQKGYITSYPLAA